MAWMKLTEPMERALTRMASIPAEQRFGKIHDVKIKTMVKHSDVRGFFVEQLKRGDVDDEGRLLLEDGMVFAQISRSLAFARGGNPPELIKAFHWHKKQWDYWDIVSGDARIVLVDLRGDSPSAGIIQQVIAGEHHTPRVVAIPPYVAHGYQCLGMEDVQLVYYVTEPYNPADPDEGRIAWNDPRIGFDWRIENI